MSTTGNSKSEPLLGSTWGSNTNQYQPSVPSYTPASTTGNWYSPFSDYGKSSPSTTYTPHQPSTYYRGNYQPQPQHQTQPHLQSQSYNVNKPYQYSPNQSQRNWPPSQPIGITQQTSIPSAYERDPFYGTVHSLSMRVVAWCLIRVLLDLYYKHTDIRAPGEVISDKETPQDIKRRYMMLVTTMAKQVDDYAKGRGNDYSDAYVQEELVKPFLRLLNREYINFGKRLPMPPSHTNMRYGRGLGRNVYELHTLFSVLHKVFYPNRFTYDAVRLEMAIMMANDSLKLILARLFEISPVTGKLKEEQLFEEIATNNVILSKIQCADYVDTKTKGDTFYKISSISTKIVACLSDAAQSSLHYISDVIPILIPLDSFRAQIERLQMMH